MDHVRNTVAGHIQIDYRIACAMINYTHKPCCPDGKNASKVAEKLKERALFRRQINHLEFLLAKRFETSMMLPVNLADINDFPKLKKYKISQKILFGTFQLKQCKSYITELIGSGKGYILSDKYIKTIHNQKIMKSLSDGKTKIVGVNIVSRHSRSLVKKISKNKNQIGEKKYKTIYKVFIEYKPNVNKTGSIKR